MIEAPILVRAEGEFEYYADFVNLWKEYVEDLHSKEPRVADYNPYIAYEAFHQKDMHLYICYFGGKAIGFAMVGTRSNKQKKADWHILEFFVSYRYRNRHFGCWMAEELKFKYGNVVTLHVLYNNPRAEKFWQRVFSDYEDITDKFDLSDELVKGKAYRKWT